MYNITLNTEEISACAEVLAHPCCEADEGQVIALTFKIEFILMC